MSANICTPLPRHHSQVHIPLCIGDGGGCLMKDRYTRWIKYFRCTSQAHRITEVGMTFSLDVVRHHKDSGNNSRTHPLAYMTTEISQHLLVSRFHASVRSAFIAAGTHTSLFMVVDDRQQSNVGCRHFRQLIGVSNRHEMRISTFAPL